MVQIMRELNHSKEIESLLRNEGMYSGEVWVDDENGIYGILLWFFDRYNNDERIKKEIWIKGRDCISQSVSCRRFEITNRLRNEQIGFA